MMKKMSALLLVLCLVLSFAACNNGENTSSAPANETDSGTEATEQTSENTEQTSGNTEQTESHTHTYAKATCTKAATCSCGVTEGDALGHSWQDATCQAPKTCKTCGATEGDALGHSWQDATCQAPKTCKTCGATEGGKGDHSYTNGICSVCGAASDPDSQHTSENTEQSEGNKSIVGFWSTAERSAEDWIMASFYEFFSDGTFVSGFWEYEYYLPEDGDEWPEGWSVVPMGRPLFFGTYSLDGGQIILNYTHDGFGEPFEETYALTVQFTSSEDEIFFNGTRHLLIEEYSCLLDNDFPLEELCAALGVDMSTP